jgi:hypothetical protein
MAMFTGKSGGRSGLALVVAASCLGAPVVHAQTAPVAYYLSGWPLGFGGDASAGQGVGSYGNFPGFEARDAGGFSYRRYNFSNGWFVGGERGGLGLTGFGATSAFGNFGGLAYDGVQFGYNFKNSGGLPLSVFAGFDTLNYKTGIGGPPAAFDNLSGTQAGYGAHAGVEFQPAPNVSLSLGFGVSQQQSGRLDSDINSPLVPGATPFAFGGRR